MNTKTRRSKENSSFFLNPNNEMLNKRFDNICQKDDDKNNRRHTVSGINRQSVERHTVSGVNRQSVEAKLMKYKLLIDEEHKIKNRLHRTESDLELSLPVASERMRNMYQSSLRQLKRQRSITDIRTINFARETFFRGGTPPTEITIVDDLKDKPTKTSSRERSKSFKHDFPRKNEERRAIASEKAERRRVSLNSLQDDLNQANSLLEKYKETISENAM